MTPTKANIIRITILVIATIIIFSIIVFLNSIDSCGCGDFTEPLYDAYDEMDRYVYDTDGKHIKDIETTKSCNSCD